MKKNFIDKFKDIKNYLSDNLIDINVVSKGNKKLTIDDVNYYENIKMLFNFADGIHCGYFFEHFHEMGIWTLHKPCRALSVVHNREYLNILTYHGEYLYLGYPDGLSDAMIWNSGMHIQINECDLFEDYEFVKLSHIYDVCYIISKVTLDFDKNTLNITKMMDDRRD